MKIEFVKFVEWLNNLLKSQKYYTIQIEINAGHIVHVEKTESIKEL